MSDPEPDRVTLLKVVDTVAMMTEVPWVFVARKMLGMSTVAGDEILHISADLTDELKDLTE